jgi:ribonuclease Z
MLPKAPPRTGQVGFLYVPPYRIQGVSVAGEQTVVHVPELDLAFDIGLCPRIALSASHVALSHGHMDHVAGLPYYFSQRIFQRMGVGTCVCHRDLAAPLEAMMQSWVALEGQRTPHQIIPLDPDGQVEVKNNVFLRGFEVTHATGAMAYAVVERRSKLKQEYHNQPQERLRALKESGVAITRTMEIPLVAYTGDTELGPWLFRDEFVGARIVVAECTFFDPGHESRARIGKHLHVNDLAKLVQVWQAETIVLVHLSRRTNLAAAHEHLREALGEEHAGRILFLMDHRANRQRYERQELEIGSATEPG